MVSDWLETIVLFPLRRVAANIIASLLFFEFGMHMKFEFFEVLIGERLLFSLYTYVIR